MLITPYNDVVNVCQTDLLPVRIGGLIQHVLSAYFSDSRNIQTPQLKQYTYNPNPLESKIRIEQIYKWDPRIADKAPAIIIRYGDVKQNLLVLGANECTIGGHPASVSGWTVSIALLCISRLPAEADLLATEVIRLFNNYRRNIMQYLRLNDLVAPGRGDLSRVGESSLFTVPVVLSCSFSDVAKTEKPPAPRIVIGVR